MELKYIYTPPFVTQTRKIEYIDFFSQAIFLKLQFSVYNFLTNFLLYFSDNLRIFQDTEKILKNFT